ncbi:MAG: flagellar basal body P-ring formation chaperone FlgA [Desulfomonilia bacterium]
MRKTILIVLAVITMAAPDALTGQATIVHLKAQASVSGDMVRAGDIADIRGPEKDAVAGIPIMQAPKSPLPSSISAAYIAQKIRSVHPGDVVYTGAAEVSVSQKYVIIPTKTLEAIFVREVMSHTPWRERAKITIESFRAPRCVQVREMDRQIMEAKFSSHEDFVGLTSMMLQFGHSPPSSTVHLSARIRVIADVPVPKVRIDRGDIISAADLETRAMDISNFPSVLLDHRDCLGMQAKTTLRAGRPIMKTNIEVPPTVSRGDVVIIQARTNNLIVQDKGIALRDGNLSDQIPVKNISSGRQVIGTIIAASVIQVEI